MSIIEKLKIFFKQGHPRSIKLKKNISASLVIKSVAVALGLIKVPILISYLDPEKYGVWLTISSIIMWVQYFDLGLGHGLRNKFAEALANNDMERGKKLVSTAYASISLLMLGILITLSPVIFVLDWNQILNVTTISNTELQYSVLIVLIMFILRFVFHLITVILKADQRPAISDIFMPASGFVSLVLVLIVRLFITDSLLVACTIISVPPALVLLVANIYFFNKDYKLFKPVIGLVDKHYINDIYSLGLKFFVIQLGGLVMFSSSNIILTQVINPQEVTIYNVANKYYELPLMFFMIILTPYWSAITEAYVKKEFGWIKSNIGKLFKVGLLFSLGLIVMFLVSDLAFSLWLGGSIIIPVQLSIVFVVKNIFMLLLSPYNYFLNGVGKLNLGIRLLIFKIIVYLPVAVTLSKHYGAAGLVLALILTNSLPNLVFNTIQYKKIINRKAYGIWNA